MIWPAPVAAAAGAGFLAWAVRGRSSSVFAPSVGRGPRDRRSIALTFDDGPSESTPELLDVLAAHGARATFFVCGRNITRLAEIGRRVAAAGHEIGNHTETHARLWLRTPESIYREMAGAQESIEAVLGRRPRWFRAPFGVRWPGLGRAQRRLDLMGVMWTVIGRDWKRPAGDVAARVARGASNGAIVCLHDGRGLQRNPDIRETVKAVRLALPVLASRGYRFETLSDLLCQTS